MQKIFLSLCFLIGIREVYAAGFKVKIKSDECSSIFSARENFPEIVPVTILSPEWPNIRTGTGAFVGDSQTLAVPFHLAFPLKQSEHLKYFFEDPNTGESVPLQPYAADLKSDLMLLKTPENYQSDSFYPIERLVDIEEIKDSEDFIMVGFSGWQEQWTLAQGTMSTYRESTGKYLSIMASKNAVQGGSSGSPAFSMKGSILGTVVIQAASDEAIFITPAGSLKNLFIRSDSSACRTTVCIKEWEKWKERALSGDKEAQFLLGEEAVVSGQHIRGEYERAIPWLKDSVEQDYAPALEKLGNMFHEGMGVSPDILRAKEYYRRAADIGDAIAQYSLGMIAMKEEDPKIAARWFFKSAQQGFPLAEYELGIISFLGNGIEKDYVVAEQYLLKAAQYGISFAKLALGQLYNDQREFIKAKRWLLEVQHFPEALYEIAVMVARGAGFEQNPQEAHNWFQKAADGGDSHAQFHIGMSYIIGIERGKDIEKGIFYLTRSAQQGDMRAVYNLGYTFRIRGDFKQAMNWLLKAAYAGNPISQRNVGEMYFKGEGRKKDPALAEKWFIESAQRGYAPAMHDLGEIYKTGEGSVLRNPERAAYWLREAKKQGYTPEDTRWHSGGEKVNEIARKELIPVSQL